MTCPPFRIGLLSLAYHLWHLCEKLARRLKEHDLAAGGVVLKLEDIPLGPDTRVRKIFQPDCPA